MERGTFNLDEKARSGRVVPVGVLLALVVAAPPVGAQEQRGSIDGIVKDASGAVLPGATVEAKNTATGATLPTTSDASGRFRFASVQTGVYRSRLPWQASGR